MPEAHLLIREGNKGDEHDVIVSKSIYGYLECLRVTALLAQKRFVRRTDTVALLQ